MEPKQIVKQVIDFNKTAFDNTYEAMIVMQEQTEKMLNAIIEQNTLFPAEGKKAVADLIKSYKKGCNDFKVAADEGFKKAESFFAMN